MDFPRNQKISSLINGMLAENFMEIALKRFLSVLLLTGCAAQQPFQPAPSVQLTPEQWSAVQDGVRASLKDPQSAQFGHFRAAHSAQAGGIVVCGVVNAKNSYGGYTGQLPYGGMLAEVADGKVKVFRPFGIASAGKNGDIGVYLMCKKHGINIDAV